MVLPTIPFQMSVFLSVNLKPFLRRIDLHLFPGWQFYGFNQFCKIIMASRHSGISSDKLRTLLTCKSPSPPPLVHLRVLRYYVPLYLYGLRNKFIWEINCFFLRGFDIQIKYCFMLILFFGREKHNIQSTHYKYSKCCY